MIKLLSLFSGIGAFESALHRGGYEYDLVNYCEIDKYASSSYSQIHNVSEDLNLRDVTKVDTAKLPKDLDLITYGFPCTDISIAGKKKGFFDENGNPTRSGLFYDALKIIRDLQPKYAIAENVKNLTGKKFKEEFKSVLDGLTDIGYNNYWQILNAKDYGIPQNRERVFIVSIRKDIDNGNFAFPNKTELTLRVKDMLEDVVDQKYYLYNSKTTQLINQIISKEKIKDVECCDSTIYDPQIKQVANCITARYDAGIQTQKSIGLVVIENVGRLHNHQRGMVFSDLGISPCLSATDYKEPRSVLQHNSRTSDNEYCISKNMSWPKYNSDQSYYIKQIRDNNIETPVAIDEQNRVVRTDGTVGTLTTNGSSPKHNNRICDVDYRIRKLTPRECFRLMGFTDEEFDRIHNISNTQLYKQAGNSIVVNVLTAIFNELFNQNSVFQLE